MAMNIEGLGALNLRTGKIFPVEELFEESRSCRVREAVNVSCTIDEGVYELYRAREDGDRLCRVTFEECIVK